VVSIARPRNDHAATTGDTSRQLMEPPQPPDGVERFGRSHFDGATVGRSRSNSHFAGAATPMS